MRRRENDLLDGIRSGDEILVVVVDQSMAFAVEKSDLRVEIILCFDELGEGGGLDEGGVVDVRIEGG